MKNISSNHPVDLPIAWNKPYPAGALESVGPDWLNADHFLHPELVEAASTVGEVETLRSVYQVYKKLLSSTKVALQTEDPSRTVEAHYLEIHAAWKKRLDAIANRSTEATNSAKKAITTIEKDIANLLEVRDGPHANEIRQHVKGLPAAERVPFVLAAIDNLDKETVAAVMGGPPYLAGLTAEQRETLWNRYTDRTAAGHVATKRAIQRAVDTNFHAFNELIAAGATLFPDAAITGIAQRVERAQAARNEIFAS